MNIQKKIFVCLMVIPFFVNAAHSETLIPEQKPRLVQPNERSQAAGSRYPELMVPVQNSKTRVKSLSMTKDELKNHPELVTRALIPALAKNNAEGVAILLPIYEQQSVIDPQMVIWGNAILAAQRQDYSLSLNFYRKVFAHNPEIIPIRYQMAQVLFLNNNNIAAKEQFEKLRTETVSPLFLENIDQYLTAINQRNKWSFHGGLSYLHEGNVNNAPKAGTGVKGWKASPPEVATGVGYTLDVDKKWSLQNNLFSKVSLSGYGRYYWNNKKYNELNVRFSSGLGYQTAHTEVTIMPFTERRWYGGGRINSDSLKRFSQNSGLRLDIGYWLTPHWQASTAIEYGEQRYVKRKHLNGNNYLWSNTLLYLPNSNQFWFVGADYTRDNARDKSDANERKGIRMGYGQEWPLGISSRISLNYSKREYDAEGFAQIQQKNSEYGGQISLWHRDFHILGMTPRITWAYNEISSNNAFYSYSKNRIYSEISTRF